MSRIWESGDLVVHRGIVNHRVRVAKSMIVVRDTPQETILILMPQAPCKFPSDLIERKYAGTRNTTQSRWDVQDTGSWQMVDWLWQSQRILILMRPGQYYAVYLLWEDKADKFLGWYVNFELPFIRSPIGYDTLDLELDLIIQPNGHYIWKDESDYHEGVRRGSIATETAKQVEAARDSVMTQLQNRLPPFDTTWIFWKPDPMWRIAPLHPDWDQIS